MASLFSSAYFTDSCSVSGVVDVWLWENAGTASESKRPKAKIFFFTGIFIYGLYLTNLFVYYYIVLNKKNQHMLKKRPIGLFSIFPSFPASPASGYLHRS